MPQCGTYAAVAEIFHFKPLVVAGLTIGWQPSPPDSGNGQKKCVWGVLARTPMLGSF